MDCSHGKQLWEHCKQKYEPLWIKGGNHCDLELFPQYIKHLKKFIAAIEKSPHQKTGSGSVPHLLDKPRNSTDFREKSRSSMDVRENSRSIDYKEKPSATSDQKEKSRANIDKKDKSRKSLDRPEKAYNGSDMPEKARNSIDRSDINHVQYSDFTCSSIVSDVTFSVLLLQFWGDGEIGWIMQY